MKRPVPGAVKPRMTFKNELSRYTAKVDRQHAKAKRLLVAISDVTASALASPEVDPSDALSAVETLARVVLLTLQGDE